MITSTTKTKKPNNIDENKTINIFTNKLFLSILAVILGLVTTFLIASMQGFSPVLMMSEWITANFGNLSAVGDFLGTMSWIVILGLSLVVSFRAGVFNIGAAGQALAGGIVALWLGINMNAAGFGPIIIIFLSSLVGAIVALFIGILKTKFKIHEVVSSIMINWIIFYLWKFAGLNPQEVLDSNSLQISWLTTLFNGSSKISISIFFVIAIPIFWFIYKYTIFGYKQDILGSNPSASEYVGMKKEKETIKTFVISGALAGLAGSFIFIAQSAPPNVGTSTELPSILFEGIAVALLSAYNPLAVLFTASFVGSFINAGTAMASVTNNIPYETIIMGTSIFWIALFNIFNYVDIQGKIEAWLNKNENSSSNSKKEGDK